MIGNVPVSYYNFPLSKQLQQHKDESLVRNNFQLSGSNSRWMNDKFVSDFENLNLNVDEEEATRRLDQDDPFENLLKYFKEHVPSDRESRLYRIFVNRDRDGKRVSKTLEINLKTSEEEERIKNKNLFSPKNTRRQDYGGKHDWFNREDNYEEARRKVKTNFVEHETMRVHPKQHFQRHPTQPGTNDKRYSRRLDFENILARPRIRPSKKIRRFRSYLNERATRKRVPNYKGHARSARFIPTLDLGASEAGRVRRGRSG